MKKQTNSYFRDVVERFFRHKLAVIGIAFIIFEVLVVSFLPMIMELNPNVSDFLAGITAAPSDAHILGTDDVGRDVFARLIYGGRVSLLVGVASAMISVLIGIPLGLLAGYYRGIVEMIIMRLADVFMSLPSMVLIMVLVSVLGPSISTATAVIGVMGWPNTARLLYGKVLSVRESDYVEAARAIGTKDVKIMSRYILPNAITPVLVSFTFGIANAILQESSLSFLGMGVQPPQASWGNILYAAQSITVLSAKPWIWVPTGIVLLLTVLSFNFFGDGLRDALDPKMQV
ncbi:ABC transporter permease [Roseburia hominis]